MTLGIGPGSGHRLDGHIADDVIVFYDEAIVEGIRAINADAAAAGSRLLRRSGGGSVHQGSIAHHPVAAQGQGL